MPVREKKTTRQLIINCLKTFGGWLPAACVPNEVQKQKILALVVAAGVDMVFANHCYRVGDKFYLQTDGGPIGLELAGAVHRPFMMRWDKRYLAAVANAGIVMRAYGRFVDDSNQIVEARHEDDSDEVIAAELRDIANRMVEGIEMEDDVPSRHPDNKLPILGGNNLHSVSALQSTL